MEGSPLKIEGSYTFKAPGLIAAMGQRMIGGGAKMVVEQFFRKVEDFI
jgi:carbon monoxide dehydrogenase subunit G